MLICYSAYFFYVDVETSFMPWLMEEVTIELNKSRVARAVLDSKSLLGKSFSVIMLHKSAGSKKTHTKISYESL